MPLQKIIRAWVWSAVRKFRKKTSEIIKIIKNATVSIAKYIVLKKCWRNRLIPGLVISAQREKEKPPTTIRSEFSISFPPFSLLRRLLPISNHQQPMFSSSPPSPPSQQQHQVLTVRPTPQRDFFSECPRTNHLSSPLSRFGRIRYGYFLHSFGTGLNWEVHPRVAQKVEH